MAVPDRAQQTPVRAVRSFTQGQGQFMPPISTSAAAPSQNTPATTPHPVVFNGIDSQAKQIYVGALAIGSRVTLTATIPFPNLPTFPPSTSQPTTALQSKAGDIISFTASMSVGNPINGLAIQSFSVVPQARANGQYFKGPSFPGGQAYSNFQAQVTVVVLATTATQPGNVTVTANGTLVVQQG